MDESGTHHPIPVFRVSHVVDDDDDDDDDQDDIHDADGERSSESGDDAYGARRRDQLDDAHEEYEYFYDYDDDNDNGAADKVGGHAYHPQSQLRQRLEAAPTQHDGANGDGNMDTDMNGDKDGVGGSVDMSMTQYENECMARFATEWAQHKAILKQMRAEMRALLDTRSAVAERLGRFMETTGATCIPVSVDSEPLYLRQTRRLTRKQISGDVVAKAVFGKLDQALLLRCRDAVRARLQGCSAAAAQQPAGGGSGERCARGPACRAEPVARDGPQCGNAAQSGDDCSARARGHVGQGRASVGREASVLDVLVEAVCAATDEICTYQRATTNVMSTRERKRKTPEQRAAEAAMKRDQQRTARAAKRRKLLAMYCPAQQATDDQHRDQHARCRDDDGRGDGRGDGAADRDRGHAAAESSAADAGAADGAQQQALPADILALVGRLYAIDKEIAALRQRASAVSCELAALTKDYAEPPPPTHMRAGSIAHVEAMRMRARELHRQHQAARDTLSTFLRRVNARNRSFRVQLENADGGPPKPYYLREKRCVYRPPFPRAAYRAVVADAGRAVVLGQLRQHDEQSACVPPVQPPDGGDVAAAPCDDARIAQLAGDHDLLSAVFDAILDRIETYRNRSQRTSRVITLDRVPVARARSGRKWLPEHALNALQGGHASGADEPPVDGEHDAVADEDGVTSGAFGTSPYDQRQ